MSYIETIYTEILPLKTKLRLLEVVAVHFEAVAIFRTKFGPFEVVVIFQTNF